MPRHPAPPPPPRGYAVATPATSCHITLTPDPSSSNNLQGVVWFDLQVGAKYGEGWATRHRYSQFLGLHDGARQAEVIVGTPDCEVLRTSDGSFPLTLPRFPGKSWTGRANGAWLEERRVGLDKWMRCVLKSTVEGLFSAADSDSEEFPPLVKLETLLLTFLEVPQNAERCRQQRIDEARQVLRATARSADEQGFSDSESDGLSDTDSDCSRSDCSWEDLSSDVCSLDNYMSSSHEVSYEVVEGAQGLLDQLDLTLTALREHNSTPSAAEG
mmetsp:Transcript_24693/g.57052  ORF Transcript_24693/g.57052 Transcript_24693/m.57052 type:complete len:271 (+) Transcript_24693:297-1109(+)